MAPKSEDTRPTAMSQDEFTAMLTTQMKEAVRLTLVTILEEEITALIGALPHERSISRTDRRNGHYRRDLDTTVGHIDELAVPRTRGGYTTQLFERYARRRPEMDEAISGMFITQREPGGKHQGCGRGDGDPYRLDPFCVYRVESVPYVGGGVSSVEEPPSLPQIRVSVR